MGCFICGTAATAPRCADRVVLALCSAEQFFANGQVALLALVPESTRRPSLDESQLRGVPVLLDVTTDAFVLGGCCATEEDTRVELCAARDRLLAAWTSGCGAEVWDEQGRPLLHASLRVVAQGLARWLDPYRALAAQPHGRNPG